MPRLTAMFFEYSLRLGPKTLALPVLQTQSVLDIDLLAWEVVRYKYKFYSATEVR